MFKKILSLPKKIFRLKKRYLILTVVLILLLGLFVSRKNSSQKKPEFASVKRQDLKQEVSASGTVNGKNSADLRFKSSGKLGYVNVKTGDNVTKGEVVAGLDTQDLSISLQQAQNALRDKQATVDKILDDIHLSQYGNGGFSNIGSSNETETQRQTRVTAEVARDTAADSLKAAQRAFQDAVITSPIDGIVTQQSLLPGVIVSPTDTIVQVADLSQKEFDADVDESDIGKVSPGQMAEFTLNAYGDQVFKGLVFEIEPTTHTTSSNETAVTVKISAEDPSIKTIAGLNGQVNIIISQRSNVLSIPNDAIMSDNSVYVKTPKGLENKKVDVLFQTDTDSQVNGLNEGDEVVTNPSVIQTPKNNPLQRLFRRS